ncbi:acetolactate synthase-1/2/3 large subunit [Rhizobiales bacterium GAS191]|nr:acetolactate synthase-1/2/3 large subunit [Rhizobiales bacterium GAS191]
MNEMRKIAPAEEGGLPDATVALRLAQAFARHGVTAAFGQSIPTQFHLAAPLMGIRQIPYRQENQGGAMADGYARISGRVGVVTAQNGPAATLLVAPLAEALKASIPVLALVQDVPRDSVERNAFQEIDHVRMFGPVTKWVRRIDHVGRLDALVDMAFIAATSGRPGPVALIVPADLLSEPALPSPVRGAHLGTYPLDRTQPEAESIEALARLLCEAERPLIVAGGGVHLSGAAAELAALQERAHLPVVTTVMGKGAVAERHPLSLGTAGYFMAPGSRTYAMRRLFDEADLIVLIGTRTNQTGTDSWRLFPKQARFVHLDADPLEIGRNYSSMRLCGDARSTLQALAKAMVGADLHKRLSARPALEAAIAEAVAAWRHLEAPLIAQDKGPVQPVRVMAELDRRLTDDAIVVADASYSSVWIANGLTARRAGSRFLTPRGLAGLGWGLPLAIGAQIAAPESRVICVVGDGGFGHSWAELETLARLGLPVTVIVLNNGILGYQKHAEDVVFGEHTLAVDLAPVDHAAIARACGINGIRVETPAEIGAALDAAFLHAGATLIDVVTDPDAKPPITLFEGEAR